MADGKGSVAKISVRVIPDTTGFRKAVEAGVKKEMAGYEVKIDVVPDLTNFRKKIEAATKGLEAKVNVKADTTGVRSEIDAATRGHTARVNVELTGMAATLAKIKALRAIVNRNMTARVIIDGNPLLAAAYGAAKGWKGVKTVLQSVAKWGAIIGVAFAALAPPLAALGGGAAMAALGAWAAVGAAATTLASGAISGLFIFLASKSEDVKQAWGGTKKVIGDVFKEANKPVENALIDLAPKMSKAFQHVQPYIATVSRGVADLVKRFGSNLPMLATDTAKAMEMMFMAGKPGMEKLIDGLPQIMLGLGNMFKTVGDSKAVKRIWDGLIDNLPAALESFGRGFDKAAIGAGKLFDWFKSPALNDFSGGFKDLWADLKAVDWTKAKEGVEDMLNAMGRVAEDTDVQGLVDGLGTITTAASKVVDMFNKIGIAGSIGMGIALGVAKGLATELAAALVGKGAGWLMGKLFGTAGEIATTAGEVGIGIAGGLVEGLGTGIAEGIGEGIGEAIGDLFDGDNKEDLTVELTIDSIVWPNGDGPNGVLTVDSIVWPDGGPSGPFTITGWNPPPDGGGPSGGYTVENIVWPGETENLSGTFNITEIVFPGEVSNLTGDFNIVNIVWPGETETLSGDFTISNVVFPEGALTGLTDINAVFTLLIPQLEALNIALDGLIERFTLSTAQVILFSTGLTMLTAPLLLLPALTNATALGLGLMATGITLVLTALAPLTGIVATVVGSLSSMWGSISQGTGLLSQIAGAIGNAAGTFSGFAGTVAGVAGSIIGSMVGMASGIISSISGAMSGGQGLFDGGLMGMTATTEGGAGNIVGIMAALPGRIMGALGNLGGMLISSGAAMIEGFAAGIRSAGERAVAAAQAVVARVRALFPFSPAKEGPFSGKGYTTYSGKALVKDFAGGIESASPLARDAAMAVVADVQKGIESYQKGLAGFNENAIYQPIMEGNAAKISEYHKKEVEALKNVGKDREKAAEKAKERRDKMLESLEVPDFREINTSIQSYYIDGTKGMFQKSLLKQASDTNFAGQLKNVALQAVKDAREVFGDHPVMAQVEANVNTDYFGKSIQEAIEASEIGHIPIELAISNLDQFKSDIGMGDGAISRALTAAMEFNPNNTDAYRNEKATKEEIHYHVADMNEAMRMEDERRRRGALRYT